MLCFITVTNNGNNSIYILTVANEGARDILLKPVVSSPGRGNFISLYSARQDMLFKSLSHCIRLERSKRYLISVVYDKLFLSYYRFTKIHKYPGYNNITI